MFNPMYDQEPDGNFAEQAAGVKPPRSFILDASVLDNQEDAELIRENVKRNFIEFVFPDGLNKVDLLEECRALTQIDDFDTMYDLVMQMLVGKTLTVNIKNPGGTKTELCSFAVNDKHQNLRAVDAIDEYPVIITWLTDFVQGYLVKKFPAPGNDQQPPQAPESRSGQKTKPKAPTQS
jgi:hypothetical protein